MTEITNTVLDERNVAVEAEDAVAITTEGVAINYEGRSCGKILLMISNSEQGTEDLEISVTNSKTSAIVIESGKFENLSGENKGKVVIKGEDAESLKVQVIELP